MEYVLKATDDDTGQDLYYIGTLMFEVWSGDLSRAMKFKTAKQAQKKAEELNFLSVPILEKKLSNPTPPQG